MLSVFAEDMNIPAVFGRRNEPPSAGIKDRPLVIRPRILRVFNSRKTDDLRVVQSHHTPQPGAAPGKPEGKRAPRNCPFRDVYGQLQPLNFARRCTALSICPDSFFVMRTPGSSQRFCTVSVLAFRSAFGSIRPISRSPYSTGST